MGQVFLYVITSYSIHYTKLYENLEGEGFFEVTHNETPFKVHVKNAVVQVMGTEFNVNQHKDNIVVSVVSGKVKVEAFNHAVELEKGERAIVKQGRLKEESLNSVNDLSYNFV